MSMKNGKRTYTYTLNNKTKHVVRKTLKAVDGVKSKDKTLYPLVKLQLRNGDNIIQLKDLFLLVDTIYQYHEKYAPALNKLVEYLKTVASICAKAEIPVA